MRDADEAVTAGLLSVHPVSGDYAFRHPLVRSAVVRTATSNQRRAAHAVLAGVHRDDVERRATHLAACTVDPDEEAAAMLATAAESSTGRGGARATVAWRARAVEFSENREDRSRQLDDAPSSPDTRGSSTGPSGSSGPTGGRARTSPRPPWPPRPT
ncbi:MULTISPECIES: hypothetical protein [Streptomyces]|uniref:hypothetical protein n=1 Tax=Streptomyces TaxID=1883 RepID=UPI0023DD568B|nr:hypothetical protein [Streptomyces sp. FXJ1.172]WEP00572.1 hypothetical protein A6P39_043330 [Streptomyces sp. FXJ1.172]